MRKRTFVSIFALALLLFAFLKACSMENPIMETWWVERGGTEPHYVALIKSIPEIVLTTITETIVKEVLVGADPLEVLQKINILSIEYILFSGDSSTFNGPAVGGAATSITSQEMVFNATTISAMAKLVVNNYDKYRVILHGHANPLNFTDGETVELMELSKGRATAVYDQLMSSIQKYYTDVHGAGPFNKDTWDDLITVTWYGGEKNLMGSNSPHASLNRRVELILFEIIE